MMANDALRQLKSLHNVNWDSRVSLVDVMSGIGWGSDVPASAHIVRETALGAYLDYIDGNYDRANASIDAVLACQYNAQGQLWHGTFKMFAEQPDPSKENSREWVDYDPNWRQFLGVILALCFIDHESHIGNERSQRIIRAVQLAVEGEPEDRIADWYTNPNMLHAWLQAWTGERTDNDELLQAGIGRASMLYKRLQKYGDIDEYNSPTYDGIDLFAAALWVKFPPVSEFEMFGNAFVSTICNRLNTLYHPGLGAVCGPYIRAYGLELNKYVSLVGIILLLGGESHQMVLPQVLNKETDHIHDLYFLPVFERMSSVFIPKLEFSDSDFPRRHRQKFDSNVSDSLLTDYCAIGAEYGRVPDFAKNQYVPVVIHTKDASGITQWLGVKLGKNTLAIDATISQDGKVEGKIYARHGVDTVDLQILSSVVGHLKNDELTMGGIITNFNCSPRSNQAERMKNGIATTLNFSEKIVEFSIQLTRDVN